MPYSFAARSHSRRFFSRFRPFFFRSRICLAAAYGLAFLPLGGCSSFQKADIAQWSELAETIPSSKEEALGQDQGKQLASLMENTAAHTIEAQNGSPVLMESSASKTIVRLASFRQDSAVYLLDSTTISHADETTMRVQKFVKKERAFLSGQISVPDENPSHEEESQLDVDSFNTYKISQMDNEPMTREEQILDELSFHSWRLVQEFPEYFSVWKGPEDTGELQDGETIHWIIKDEAGLNQAVASSPDRSLHNLFPEGFSGAFTVDGQGILVSWNNMDDDKPVSSGTIQHIPDFDTGFWVDLIGKGKDLSGSEVAIPSSADLLQYQL